MKGINACTALRKALLADSPEIEKELDKDSSLRQHLSRSEKDERGQAFFSKIYAQHTDRVLQNMSVASGGDLSEFAISSVYGDLMAEESRLDAKETGLLEFLACYATGYVRIVSSHLQYADFDAQRIGVGPSQRPYVW